MGSEMKDWKIGDFGISLKPSNPIFLLIAESFFLKFEI
jgi:hypothetical protein